MVDRSALDRIIASGGYIDVRTGSAPNANNIAVEKVKADADIDAAACIGCGACENLCPARPFSAIYVEGHVRHRTV